MLKEWSMSQHHMETHWRCSIPGPTPKPPHQILHFNKILGVLCTHYKFLEALTAPIPSMKSSTKEYLLNGLHSRGLKFCTIKPIH